MTTSKQKDSEPKSESENEVDKHSDKTDESQLSKLRLSQDFGGVVGAQKLTQQIPVKKPEKQWFVRTHYNQDMWFHAAILDFQEDQEAYIVEKGLWDELANEIVPKVLIPSITTQDYPFIWPIRLPSEDGRVNEWNRTNLLAAEHAREKWVRSISNMSIGSYEILVAATMYPDPTWPEFGLEEWLRLGFRDKIISSTDHPVVRRLRGEQ